MTRKKRPAPVFEVLFDGKGIYPELIPLGTLTQTLSAIRRLAKGSEPVEKEEEDEEKEDEEGEESVDDTSIRLLEVKRGSARFLFVGPSAAADLAHLRGAGRVLEYPDELGEKTYVLRPFETLSAIARRLDCSVLVREAMGEREVLAKFEPSSYQRIADKVFLTGETAITGRVMRVGGATARTCSLRVESPRRLLYCKVADQEVARQLGGMLYQDVVVTGTARWLRSTWKIVNFSISNVHQPQGGSLREAFQALREAGGHGWDGVEDPKAFLEEITGK